MDRFIEQQYKHRWANDYNLKSNMDRFIAPIDGMVIAFFVDLKSNMDRFIETADAVILKLNIDLKSNMDRFIGVLL